MAGYIESTLIKDEKIIAKAHLSLWAMGLHIILGILLTIVGGIGLILLLFVYLRYISTELAFTNKRVIAKVGFIRRQTIELRIDKVESIQVEQGIFGRNRRRQSTSAYRWNFQSDAISPSLYAVSRPA